MSGASIVPASQKFGLRYAALDECAGVYEITLWRQLKTYATRESEASAV
jgi:hypothetical protein